MLLDRLFFKGMLITKLIWSKIPIVIINTHLLANFAGDWGPHGMYARVEEKQLRQLAETVQSQPMDSVIIVVGDFNVPRGGGLYHDFLVHSGLTDLLAGDTRPTLRLPRTPLDLLPSIMRWYESLIRVHSKLIVIFVFLANIG
jgi:hypothetical protein